MKKRALSWLLALCMLVSLAPQALPTWASATESNTSGSKTESKLSSNTYSALGLSRDVNTSALPEGQQPYGKADVGNTIATNVINELYVNFNGSIHYGWSILDNIPMEYTSIDNGGNNSWDGSQWTSSNNFYGAMGYWRSGQQTVHYKSGSSSDSALFAEDGVAQGHGHNGKSSINSANKHLTYQYSKSEAFSPNTGKDNYVAEMTIDSGSNVVLYIYQVEGGSKRYVTSFHVDTASMSGGDANDKTNIIYNWEYDAMYDIAAGDMDGDGYDEIAVYAANDVRVYRYKGGILTEVAYKQAIPLQNNSANGEYKKLGKAVVTLAFGDLNADDKDELVIAENVTYWSSNMDKGTVGIYTLPPSTTDMDLQTSRIWSTDLKNGDNKLVRYANVATGDIDGDYQDELIIAGYESGTSSDSKCTSNRILYKIVKGESTTSFKASGWGETTTTIDLLNRVVDNEKQLIPPVSLTCAATQGVGHAEQLFLGGYLYSVNLNKNKNLSDVSLTTLTRISTNREYKKDNGNKANKNEIFVVNVVAGNFNGNRNGQEQIVYAFGMKHDDSDRYWYDIGYINKKSPGDADATSSSGYWYGQEQVMNYESSYNRDSSKARASLYLSLAAVDCDDDSTLMRYKGQTVTWTKPEVLTVLQSAPYFQDLQDTRDYLNQGATSYGEGYGTSSTVTTGASLKVGTYVSYEQDFSIFGVKVASIQAEAQSTHEFEYGFQATKEKSIDITYSGSAGDDYAVVYAVPYMEYQYETWVPGYTLQDDNYVKYLNTYLSQKLGKKESEITDEERTNAAKELGVTQNTTVEGSWQPSSVMVPMEPKKVLISVDSYDEIAEQTEGLEPIRGNILNSTPGEPATYDTFDSREGFEQIGANQAVTTGEGGNVSVGGAQATEKAHNFNYSYEFEAKVGAGAGGLTVGVLGGFGTNVGGGFAESTSQSCVATVDNLPSDANRYGFDWCFGTREATLNGNPVLVLEYQLGNVKQPPSPPRNLRVDSVTAESVTLKWDKVVGSGAYDIYQVSTTDPETKYFRARVPGTADSYTDTNVNPNNSYTYCVQNISQAGTKSIYSTTVKAITLTDANGSFVIKQQPGDKDNSIQTYVGGTATATIEAEYLKNGESKSLSYIWQQYDTATKKWVSCSSGYGARLELSNVTEDMDGTKYRCQVLYDANLYIYSEPVTLTIGKANSATTLTSTTESGATVNASYMKKETVTTGKTTGPLEEPIDGKTYLVYTINGNETKVYMREGKYYLKSTDNALTELIEYPKNVQLTYIVNTNEGGQETETVEEKTISFIAMTKDNTFDPNTTKVTYTYQAEPENTSGDGEGSTDSESTAETYTATERYTVTDNTNVVVYHCQKDAVGDTPAVDFWFVSETNESVVTQYAADVQTATKLKIGNDYVDINDLVQATTEVDIVKTEETSYPGTPVTLTATPRDMAPAQSGLKLTGKVVFKIVNSVGEGSATVTETIGENGAAAGTAKATWTPTAAGVYTITAEYEGNEKYKGSVSSQTITINVVVPEQKTLMIDSKSTMTYGDAAIELKTTLLKGAKNGESASVNANLDGVTYSVKNADGTAVPITGSTFAPKAAGTYTVTATYTSGSETLTATKSIVVNKRTVTIVPEVTGTGTNKTATYSLKNCVSSDETLFENKITVACAGTASDAVAGEYPYTVTYTPGGNEAAINSKYTVVIDTMHPYVLTDDTVTVTNATNSTNGSVTLKYSLKDSNDMVDVYGTSAGILKESKLIAVASPKKGYKLKNWIINNDPVYLNGNSGAYNTSLTYTVSESLDEDYTVEAEFEPVYYTLNFSVQNNDGTITANYWNGTTTDGTFQNGGKLSPLQSVQLAANVPNKSISGWQITKNEQTETVQIDGKNYTGKTYILSNISADTTVTVLTDEATSCPVTISLVDANGKPLVNEDATVSFGDTKPSPTNGTYTYNANKHENLTVTLTLPAGLIVEEWRDSTNNVLADGNLSNDKKTWTISDLSKSYTWTVKCSTANSFKITTESKLQGDTSEGAGATAGTILVYRAGGNEVISSDSTVLQATSLRVVVTPETGYQLLSVTCNEEEKGTTGDFTINGVNENISIVATFVKKPVVTFSVVTPTGEETHGSLTANNLPISDSPITVSYGYKNAITFTATPKTGYEVDKWTVNSTEVNGEEVENSDDQTYIYTPNAETGITSDLTVTVSFKALPKATVEFSVVDKNDETEGGFDGTIQATVTRNGQSTTSDKVTRGNFADVYRDSEVTFAAEPVAGYKVTKWLVGDREQPTPPVLDIVEGDDGTTKKVQVQFEKISNEITYAIDPTSDTGHGATLDVTFLANTSTSSETVKSGNSVTTSGVLTATVNGLKDGYEIESWTLNGAPYTPDENGKLTCNVSETQGADIKVKIVRKSYQITFSATEGGTITAEMEENALTSPASVKGDKQVTFTAGTPETGYEFVGWKVDGTTVPDNTSSTYELKVSKDTTVQACYALTTAKYQVTYGIIQTDEQDNGTLAVSGLDSNGKANEGSNITFTATPAEGYQVKQWYNAATSGTEIGVAESTTYEIEKLTANASVYVQFEPIPTYNITVNVSGQGRVTATVNEKPATITNNTLEVKRHDSVVLTAEPEAGHHLKEWTGGTASQANPLILTLSDVTDHHTIAANFEVNQGVPFKTECGTGGSLEARAGYGDDLQLIDAKTGIQVDKGKKIVLKVTPPRDQAVVWTVNTKPTNELSNTYTIDAISETTTVKADFVTLELCTIPQNSDTSADYTISEVTKYPKEYGTDGQIRKGGTVSFKLTPKKPVMGLQGLPENAKVVYNSDGSYTVTVTNVASDISFQMKEYQAKTGDLQIPSGYTESTLKSALRAQIHSSVSGSDIAYLDIKLQIKKVNADGTFDWVDVTPDTFPQGGIDITIPYSALKQSGLDSSYNYSVAHMLENGIVENLSAKGETSGVTFHVNSLSPFAIGWYKASGPSGGGGGGGGGVVSTVTLSFETNGGSSIEKLTKESGTTVDLAAYKPTRAGYTFAGWFSDKALTKAVTSVKLTANTTVYAKWTQNGAVQNPFVDVKDDAYYYDAVLWAVEQKITSGTSATTFSPDASCTRAQMVTFLWRAAGSPKVENGKNPFTDVTSDAYYYDAVLWAVEQKITSGTSATTFSPDATVTRGQTVTFLYRNAGSPDVTGTMPFADVEADAYYAKAVLWAVEQKITTGTSETTFSPANDCTRGQIVTFLYRAK